MLSCNDVLKQLHKLRPIIFGKTIKKKIDKDRELNWRKKSIFFQLPYWKNNLLCHNLDVMHIVKNICDNIIGTLLDIEGKTKDGLHSRRDLKEMGIRKDLHATKRNDKWHFSAACYTLSPSKKGKVCKFLKL